MPKVQKSFWMHPMAFLGIEAQMETRFRPFDDNVSVGAR
jgi:hypothetical protein